jgi:DNA-binding beta-propeller fold protein YncE
MKRTLLGLALATLVPVAAFAQSAYTVNESTDELYTVNLANGALTLIGRLGLPYQFGDLAYDASRNTLYAVNARGSNPSQLYSVNTTTGAATLIGSTGQVEMFGLVYDPVTDKLYGSQSTGAQGFFEINRNTGAATAIGNPGHNLDGLTYNSTTGAIVGTWAGPGSFHSINRATGASTLLSTGSGFIDNNGLAYVAGSNSYYTIDWSGNLFQYDGNTYARSLVSSGFGPYDGLTLVPEPGTMIALGAGLAALAARRRRK